MTEGDLYRQLMAWLRSRHPLVLAEWEGERKKQSRQTSSQTPLLRSPVARPGAALDKLPFGANAATVTQAIKQELESLGIQGGTPGVTQDGAPCIYLMKKGRFGQAYEEGVTLARIRDTGYRRYLRQVFT